MAIDKKYLIKIGNTWQLAYRLPERFGGKILRVSLRTSDIKMARHLRDEFISQFSYNETATRIAENILKLIQDKTEQNNKLIQQYKNHLFAVEDTVCINEAIEKYLDFLTKANIRKSTFKSYRAALTTSFEIINDMPLDQLTKDDAIKIREYHLSRISPTRIKFNFERLKQFLSWCKAEGLSLRNISEDFDIALPTVRKQHTAIIPETAADKAIKLIPDWIAPVIARYTGCRLMEIVRLTKDDIIIESGIKCFKISSESKTHEERLVPIADKLKPYLKNFNGVTRQRHGSEKWNKLVKALPGCKECSFHSWRVYANSQLHKNNVDPYLCKKILGHTTGKDIHGMYTRFEIESMKTAVDTIF